MYKIQSDIENKLKTLQSELATIDLMTDSSSGSGFIEFLVLTMQDMKLKMYQEKGHPMPHIHIDYGKNKHTASYSIQSGERLAGSLKNKYDKKIKGWIGENNQLLLQLWESTQKGENVLYLIAELKEKI